MFGAFFQPDFTKYNNPILVSSVDGVGTKLKIAFLADKHNTVGQDLVNHCVNDIAVCGATPLFFLDYLAFDSLNPQKAELIISGFAKACRENGCALIGGETAEMPGIYQKNEYDMSGTIVGIVEKSKIIEGKNIKKGDILVGFPSNGLHTNGYSLARIVLLPKFSLDENPGLDNVLGEELLRIHKSYLKLISKLTESMVIKGLSHITGGGIIGNTKRIIPEGLHLQIEWNNWEVPKIFKLIKETGKISDEEMNKAFNMGIGLIAIVDKNDEQELFRLSREVGEIPITIGEVI
jgi:phosphoribosylformylglycinamidine cyclo-ligase